MIRSPSSLSTTPRSRHSAFIKLITTQNYDQNFTHACFALLGSRGRRRFATLHGLRRAHRRFYVTRVQGGQRDPRTGWSLCPAGKPADTFRKPAVRKPAVRKPAVYMADPSNDKRPPSWNGTGGRVVQELYIRYAEGRIRGLSDLDRDRGCVRLWRGLQGVAAVRMEKADLGRLTAEKAEGELASGWLYFLAQLNEKFPETALRQLPRVYRGFFNDVVWRGDMETLILDIEKAASLLEGSDTDAKVSDGMCGYWTLLRSRLADGEVKHIIGLAGGQLNSRGFVHASLSYTRAVRTSAMATVPTSLTRTRAGWQISTAVVGTSLTMPGCRTMTAASTTPMKTAWLRGSRTPAGKVARGPSRALLVAGGPGGGRAGGAARCQQ